MSEPTGITTYQTVQQRFTIGDYDTIDMFIEGEQPGVGEVAVCHTSQSTNQEQQEQHNEYRYVLPRNVVRQHITLPVQSYSELHISVKHAVVRYAYLSHSEHVLEQGIQVVNLDPSNTAWPVLPNYDQIFTKQRPLAHFEPAQHWMNDPNGLCYFQGRYHLFFQFNPYGWGWDTMHWNHAVSQDLVHWTLLPIALEPQADFAEHQNITGGAFSGSAITVDRSGNPCSGDKAYGIRIYLTRHQEVCGDITSAVEWQATALSTDGVHFGVESSAVTYPGEGYGIDFRDPKVELGSRLIQAHAESGADTIEQSSNASSGIDDHRAYMVVASNIAQSLLANHEAAGIYDADDSGVFMQSPSGDRNLNDLHEDQIPAMALFSAALPLQANTPWRYEGPLLADRAHRIAKTYECPDFFELDGAVVAMGALMHYQDNAGRFQPVHWYVGQLNGVQSSDSNGVGSVQPRLQVHNSGAVDFGNAYYATQSFYDDACVTGGGNGRRIVFAWLADYAQTQHEQAGLAHGTMALPRQLSLKNNRVYTKPIDEVYRELVGQKLLHLQHDELLQFEPYHIAENAYYADIRIADASDFSMIIARRTTDKGEQSIRVMQRDGVLRLKTTGMQSDHIDFRVDEDVHAAQRVEVFVDRTVVEVYVNDGEQAGTLQFPIADEGVFAIEEPGAITSVDLYQLHCE